MGRLKVDIAKSRDRLYFYGMLYIASDHAGFKLKEDMKQLFNQDSIEFEDLSQSFDKDDDYPLVGQKLAAHVLNNPKSMGIAICGTGQGICMSLNRFDGIRAGITNDLATVIKIREHNDANILCLPGSTSADAALTLAKEFIKTPVSNAPRHVRRREQLDLDRSQEINN